jgi:hypothetical protein
MDSLYNTLWDSRNNGLREYVWRGVENEWFIT